MQKTIKIFLQAVVIAVVCTAAGMAFNLLREEGIPLVAAERDACCPDELTLKADGTVLEVPDAKKAAGKAAKTSGPIDLTGAKALYDQGAVFIDARAKTEYDKGHIKGAINIFYADVSKEYDHLLEKVDLDKTIVTYCSGEECHSSDLLARDLRDMGYEKVRTFFAGWPAWKAAGYPMEPEGKGAEPLYKPMGIK